MPGLIRRLLSPPANNGIAGIPRSNHHSQVLAITADIGFYAGVLNAATSVQWARTLGQAVEICRLKSTPIVIYDGNLPGVEWECAFDRPSAVANHPRILLAATSIDENLWRNVLQRHGYDVVERSAGSEELKRVFRFASLSLLTPAAV